MLITDITIIKGQGPDVILMETDLPSGIWPFKGRQSVKTEVAAGSGEQYVGNHFPHVSVRVVDVPMMRLRGK